MREEAGVGHSIRKGTKRGKAKRRQEEVLKLLQVAAAPRYYSTASVLGGLAADALGKAVHLALTCVR